MPLPFRLHEFTKLVLFILFFYRRIFIPLLVVSIVITVFSISIVGYFSIEVLAYGYFILNALFHYFIYEIGSPEEYYFYYNLGLSKALLWAASMIISSIITFSLLAIW